MDERRYYGLDALRGGMMMLGIVLHAAMLYLTSPPPTAPMPVERNNAYVFDLIFAFIHSFRMPAFFLLSGFFTALLVEKRGLWGTYRNRAARVLGPLLVGVVTLLPVTMLFMLDFYLSVRFGTHDFIPNGDDLRTLGMELQAKGVPAGEPALVHLWFLYYLCMFYLLIPLCRGAARVSRRFAAEIERRLATPLALVAAALCTALPLWFFHAGQVHEGFILLTPHPPSLLYYGFFFVAGYLLHSHRGLLSAIARRVRVWAILSVLLFPLATIASAFDHGAPGAEPLRHLAAVLANAFCTWALVLLGIGAALRYFDRESPWIQYVSQSSYWVFLVHMPLVALVGWLLVPFDLPAVLKFALVCGFAAVVAFASFHYGVQKTWISSFLHGRRFNLAWPWRGAHDSIAASVPLP